jgi:hypothetical protein
MKPRLSVGSVVRGLVVVAAATVVSLPCEALALPRDRITARRLTRILPPGSTLTMPATPVPPRRPAVVRAPASPAAPRRLAVPPQAAAVAAKTPAPAGQTAAKNAVPAPQAAAATAAATQPAPAAASGVQQAGGGAPAAKGVTPTAAWTLDDAPAGDGTKSVLVPESKQPTPADPIELLPTP